MSKAIFFTGIPQLKPLEDLGLTLDQPVAKRRLTLGLELYLT